MNTSVGREPNHTCASYTLHVTADRRAARRSRRPFLAAHRHSPKQQLTKLAESCKKRSTCPRRLTSTRICYESVHPSDRTDTVSRSQRDPLCLSPVWQG